METLIATIIVLAFILIGVLVCALLIQGRDKDKTSKDNADRWHKFSADTLKAALAINTMEIEARKIDAEIDIATAGAQKPDTFPNPGKRSLSPEAASMMGFPQEYHNGDPTIMSTRVDSTMNPN
jgi:hypothetical protein